MLAVQDVTKTYHNEDCNFSALILQIVWNFVYKMAVHNSQTCFLRSRVSANVDNMFILYIIPHLCTVV